MKWIIFAFMVGVLLLFCGCLGEEDNIVSDNDTVLPEDSVPDKEVGEYESAEDLDMGEDIVNESAEELIDGSTEFEEDYSCVTDDDCMERNIGNACMDGICGYAQEPLEVLEMPIEVEENCFGFVVGDPREGEFVKLVGGAWIRPHPGPFSWEEVEPRNGEFDFSGTDKWVTAAQEAEVGILATIWPYAMWDQETCRGSECVVPSRDQFLHEIPESRCVPCSYSEYGEFLSALVERYDGDGVDDMPGLTLPVKYWEIMNEPEMNSETLTFYMSNKEEYIELMEESGKAIKGACDTCYVVQGGAAGSHETPDYWEDIFSLGGGEYFDVANIHFIGYWDVSTFNVADWKELISKHNIDKPIWVTEAEVDSLDTLESSFYGALDAGASKIFFTGLYIGGDKDKFSGPMYSEEFMDLECR